jgi:hypothetical protein
MLLPVLLVSYIVEFSSSGYDSVPEETYSSKISPIAGQDRSWYFFLYVIIITDCRNQLG